MPLRQAAEYVEALRDNRNVFYLGKRIPDVTLEPDLRVAVDHAALDFRFADDPANRDLAVVSGDDGEEYSAYYRLPRSSQDLLDRARLIEATTAAGGTMVTLVKEIGSDALFALHRVLEGEALERAQQFYAHCRKHDLALAVAQSDVKGDRSLGPSDQADPDLYVHVVDQDESGIVVRGAKIHTSVSANADELIVLPTRAMRPQDADYAVAFAVPVATEGLTLYVSSYSAGERAELEFPLSSRHKMLETLTVFDDVFVPWERVFVCREPKAAGPLALTFVEYHRFTAVSYKLPLLDALVGAAYEIVDMNGLGGVGHIRDKLAQLVTYAETVRALGEAAALRCRLGNLGLAYPESLMTNMAKYTFATGFHHALELLQECAGGLIVTGFGDRDWESPETRAVLEKYLSARVGGEERQRMMHLIADLTARDFAGYHAVLAVHAEGSIEAEKLQILRSYNSTRTTDYARSLARLPKR
ncbi:MAG TPA: 4-hydroxyphenylacetate 3-hydroxylase N-terminal domain-containing protein [Acidimicrobiales bacterium]|nr:4-hydroxyphenylacetate 3-hydroxylase N-terminal domain-containing protein [Acidimicrobiales bacterium]